MRLGFLVGSAVIGVPNAAAFRQSLGSGSPWDRHQPRPPPLNSLQTLMGGPAQWAHDDDLLAGVLDCLARLGRGSPVGHYAETNGLHTGLVGAVRFVLIPAHSQSSMLPSSPTRPGGFFRTNLRGGIVETGTPISGRSNRQRRQPTFARKCKSPTLASYLDEKSKTSRGVLHLRKLYIFRGKSRAWRGGTLPDNDAETS